MTSLNESDNVQSVALVSSLTQFIEWVAQIGEENILFRGLANKEWGGESSLYRRLRLNGLEDIDIDSDVFLEMTKILINRARKEEYDIENNRKLNDLELLANLQHYGAATCLIDFTKNSHTALCFACESADNKTGKVIAFNSDHADLYDEISIENSNNKIEYWLTEYERNKKLWIWSPKKSNNRITSQQSAFVFGSPTLSTKKFHICEITNKEKILEELKKNGISVGMLFDDFIGFSTLNSHNRKYENWDTDSDFVSGRICHASKNFKSAIKYYDKEIKYNPKHWAAYINRGLSKNNLDRFQDAISDYDEAIKLNPKSYEAYHNRGFAKHNLDKFQDAISDYDEAIKLNPNHWVTYNNRGQSKEELRNFQDAMSDYNEAIKLNPKYSLAYNNRGLTKNKLYNLQGAINDFDKAIRLNPKLWKAYFNRGIAKHDLRKFQDAISDYDEVIKLNPKYWVTYYNLGILKIESGDIKGAAADFAKAKELNPELKIPGLPPRQLRK